MVDPRIRKILNARRKVYGNGAYIVNDNASLTEQLQELQDLANDSLDDKTKEIMDMCKNFSDLNKAVGINIEDINKAIDKVNQSTRNTYYFTYTSDTVPLEDITS